MKKLVLKFYVELKDTKSNKKLSVHIAENTYDKDLTKLKNYKHNGIYPPEDCKRVKKTFMVNYKQLRRGK